MNNANGSVLHLASVAARWSVVVLLFISLSPVDTRGGGCAPPRQGEMIAEGLLWAIEPPARQMPDAPPMGGGRAEMRVRPDMERQRRHLEQLRLLKLLEVLDLSDNQEEPFLSAFRAMRKAQRALDERKGDLIGRLSLQIQNSSKDDKKVNALVDSVVSIEDEKRVAIRGFFDKARTILTAEQAGKLVIFQERFEYELLERVREFRERNRMGRPVPEQSDSN